MTFLSPEQIKAFNHWNSIYNLTYRQNKCIINQLKCDVKQATKQSSLPYKNNRLTPLSLVAYWTEALSGNNGGQLHVTCVAYKLT